MDGDKPWSNAARGEHVPERPRDSVKATLSKVAAAAYMTKNRICPRMEAGSGAASARLAVMSNLANQAANAARPAARRGLNTRTGAPEKFTPSPMPRSDKYNRFKPS